MRIEIKGNTRYTGASVKAPQSKSVAHRLLICAGLTGGISTISGVDLSEDILATIDCLKALGVVITGEDAGGENASSVHNVTLRVRGKDPRMFGHAVLHCRESGSTLRFLTPIAALSGRDMTLTGSSKLLSRPMSVYEELFAERGLTIEKSDDALRLCGRLTPGEYTVPGDISSQFISGLLFALPLLAGDSRIVITGRAESRPYIDMTIDALRRFGVWTEWEQEGQVLTVPGGQSYKANEAAVEGDWSGAAFLYALGADVTGLNKNSVQGDKVCLEYFRALDEGPACLDITDCPDLGPVLAAYAALRNGGTLTGTRRLRYKESDRMSAIQEELAKFGINVETTENSMTVGSSVKAPEEILKGHNDHRIVMALAVICAQTGGVIDGAEAVSKSFPDFFEKLQHLGVSAAGIGVVSTDL